jgi:hypothetical protein
MKPAACPACGVAWEHHLGIAGTCKRFTDARMALKRIARTACIGEPCGACIAKSALKRMGNW